MILGDEHVATQRKPADREPAADEIAAAVAEKTVQVIGTTDQSATRTCAPPTARSRSRR